MNENWLNKLSNSLEELRAKMNKSMENAVDFNREQVTNEKDMEIEKLRESYERILDRERNEYEAKIEDLLKLHSTINSLKNDNDQLKYFINDLKKEFQNSIERFTDMRKKEGDFLFKAIGEDLNLEVTN